MTDDAKRDGLIAFCEQGKDCEPATPWEEGYMAAMRVVVQHIKSAAPVSAQTPAGEVAAWECRHFDPQYGWSPWERIEPRHRLETIEGRVNDIREFIKLGNKYQLRALYAEGEPEGYAHE